MLREPSADIAVAGPGEGNIESINPKYVILNVIDIIG